MLCVYCMEGGGGKTVDVRMYGCMYVCMYVSMYVCETIKKKRMIQMMIRMDVTIRLPRDVGKKKR